MKRNKTIVSDINKMFPAASADYPVCFMRSGEDQVIVSGECYAKEKIEDEIFEVPVIDYYGEFTGGYPHIHSKLIAYAEQQNAYWEWENAACIILIKN